MKVYDLGFDVLKAVLKDKISFANSSRDNLVNIKADLRNDASSLCGLFLRNYFSLEAIAEYVFGVKEIEPFIYIGLVYMNNSYKKLRDIDESNKYLQSKLALYQVKCGSEQMAVFKEAYDNKRLYLDKVLKGNGNRSISCRSNLPIWVIKMLFRQYDKGTAQKIINTIVKMPDQFGVANTLMLNGREEEILSKYKRIEGQLFQYNSNTSIRKDSLVRNSVISPIQKAEYFSSKILPALENKNVTFYFEDKNGYFALMMNKYLPKNNLNLLSPIPNKNKDVYGTIKPKGFEHLLIDQSTISGAIAVLSEKQDLVVVMPKSSNLELLRRTPEYGIFFDTSELDGIIADEERCLHDAAALVKQNGYLAYCVPTFNIKETLVMTMKFLESHKDFKKVKEVTYFPHEEENSIFHFVLFKKG